MRKEKEAVPLPGYLKGDFLVRVNRAALHDACDCLKTSRNKAIARRHALKLRYWPNKHPIDDSGKVLDLDWSWVKACRGEKIAELRIAESIGDNNNVRIIFYLPQYNEEIPTIWVLALFQKKDQAFTKANIATFKARRKIIEERFYGSN